ncbi:MAG: cation-translocating P-type ATPase [Acidimicrobiia bacterium]|nr:cation-translocating P-type ATPase [Acidimicrobiia bacterium]
MTAPSTETTHQWWAEPSDVIARELDTDLSAGLRSEVAAERLDRYGHNELEEEPTRSPWLLFFGQFANTMIVVLLIAAAVTVAVGEVKDALVIGAIVVLNAAIGFVQEYRAEQAMAALKSMASPSAKVIRDGRQTTIPAADVVPGDVLILDAGDVIAADGRLIECPNLRVNEAALTGESVPVEKTPDPISSEAGRMVAERHNMVFRGTAVVYGRARLIVVDTGMSTELGQIAGLLKAHQAPQTPLQRRLAALGRWLAFASLVVCALVFTVGVLRGEEVSLMFLTAVSLAVAAIPEALPAVVTIALALGAQRMVQQHALVRKLPAVETLGSVTVICTDKTGTLTEGRMLVERAWTFSSDVQITGVGFEPVGRLTADDRDFDPSGDEAFSSMAKVAALCNDAVLEPPNDDHDDWRVGGDPTEGALLAFAAKVLGDLDQLSVRFPRIGEMAFDSDRKRMSTFHQTDDDAAADVVFAKGGVEALIEKTTHVAVGNRIRPIAEDDEQAIHAKADEFARDGYRVLAVGGREAEPGDGFDADLEHDLVFYGLVAMADPPRAASHDAVAACRSAGITPVMITGDHPATGRAIADRLGIIDHHDVLTGAQLADLAPEAFADRVEDIAVYARSSPEQKLDIVQAWQANGDIVAMTGDGVNDAPALRTADIGVAMGVAGTDVAKEAADMVLTDDNFATIVGAVREGRRIYDNIRRFVRYTLTSNSGEIWVMFLGPFFGLPLPLLPVHILWINLVTDGLPGLALGVEQAERGVMKRPPRPPTENIFARGLWQHVVLVGLLMGAIPLALGIWGEANGRPWQTMIFTSLALLQLANSMAVRSEHDSVFTLGLTSNRPLLATVIATAAIQIGLIYWGPMQNLLTVEALSLFELSLVLLASTGVFWVVEGEKWVRRRLAER